MVRMRRQCWLCEGTGASAKFSDPPLDSWRPRGVCRTPAKSTDGPVYRNSYEPMHPELAKQPGSGGCVGEPEETAYLYNLSKGDVSAASAEACAKGQAIRYAAERLANFKAKLLSKTEEKLPEPVSPAASGIIASFGSLGIGDRFAFLAGSRAAYTKVWEGHPNPGAPEGFNGGDAQWDAEDGTELKCKSTTLSVLNSTVVYNVVKATKAAEEPDPSAGRSLKVRPFNYVIIKGSDGVHYPELGPIDKPHSELIKGHSTSVPVSAGCCNVCNGILVNVKSVINDIELDSHPDDADIIREFYLPSSLKLPKFDRKAVFAMVDESNHRMSYKRAIKKLRRLNRKVVKSKTKGTAKPWNKGRKTSKL